MGKLVSEIMAKDIISLEIEDSLKDAANIFEQIRIRHIPVVSGESLLGIVSKSDVARMKEFCQILESGSKEMLAELEAVSVKVIMKKPITINASQTVKEAAEILSKSQFHALPVVSDNKMVGVITSTDIIKYFVLIGD